MKAAANREPDNDISADRLSRLAEACLRIASNLDIDAVLQGVIDAARSLTGARYGALVSFDGSGDIRDLVTSGMTPEERRRMGPLPKGLGLLGYLNEVPRPLRLRDIASHARSVGFPENHPPMKTFLGAPVRHLGESVGNIYLTEKEGGREFTSDDEDTLVLFAAQAATAIANAHRYREERQVRSQLETVVQASLVGIAVVDADTRNVVMINREMQRIFGVTPQFSNSLASYRQRVTHRYPDGSVFPIDRLPLERALQGGESLYAEEVVLHRTDGGMITVLMNAVPIRLDDGRIEAAVVTVQDMTPMEEMERQRAEFLAIVSRELRTPLTAIKGSATTMLGSRYPLSIAETRQFLRIIDDQADNMRHLINDLVDMTQIDVGTLTVDLEPTDVEDLLDSAKEEFLGEGMRNHIQVDLAPDLPRVTVDKQRILQVLRTLLTNASEYSPDSSTIRVSASPEDVYVAISVEGEGTGVAEDRLSHLFKRFSWIDGEDKGRSIEHGLGLAICKGIVEAHGGRISVESGGPGRGARFTFTVPVADETDYSVETDSSQIAAHSRQSERDQARILAVDEDPQTLRHLRSALSEAGFTPVVTGDPDEIERLMEVKQPHLVLLDMTQPWTNGVELMERIRKISGAPVIFVSGHGSGQNMDRAFELGAADYVVKPFTPTELAARIRAALRRRASPVQTEPPEPFVLGGLTIDYAERLVTVAGRQVQLTATEYNLLFEFSAAAGRVLTYEQLLRRVWGPVYSTDVRIVHTYIKQLRGKLGDDARHPTYIFTEPRVGYRMPNQRQPLGAAEE